MKSEPLKGKLKYWKSELEINDVKSAVEWLKDRINIELDYEEEKFGEKNDHIKELIDEAFEDVMK